MKRGKRKRGTEHAYKAECIPSKGMKLGGQSPQLAHIGLLISEIGIVRDRK